MTASRRHGRPAADARRARSRRPAGARSCRRPVAVHRRQRHLRCSTTSTRCRRPRGGRAGRGSGRSRSRAPARHPRSAEAARSRSGPSRSARSAYAAATSSGPIESELHAVDVSFVVDSGFAVLKTTGSRPSAAALTACSADAARPFAADGDAVVDEQVATRRRRSPAGERAPPPCAAAPRSTTRDGRRSGRDACATR